MNTQLIFKQLFSDKEYLNKVLPFLKEEYFESKVEQALFRYVSTFVTKYNKLANESVVEYLATNDSSLHPDDLDELSVYWDSIQENKDENDVNWLVEITEEWCKERAIHIAVAESISIITEESKKNLKGSIPNLLKDALAVSFDSNVGHDFILDAAKRFEYYHKKEVKVPFDIELLNKVTNGGFSQGTLNLFIGGTNTGKTLFMCHLAGSYLKNGYNVLYITLEMAEEEIAKRIDANIMNVRMNEVFSLKKDTFRSNIERIKSKTIGRLLIKQYPPAAANINHFRALLNELQLKKGFKPDIIIVDYLGLCSSARLRSSENSFKFYQSVSEELRGLAIEQKIPIISNHQTNRSGQYSTDIDLNDVSESHGISMTVDFMAALIVSEELIKEKKLIIKQLKSRYNDATTYYNKFVVGMDREYMRLFDVEGEFQTKQKEPAPKPTVDIDFN